MLVVCVVPLGSHEGAGMTPFRDTGIRFARLHCETHILSRDSKRFLALAGPFNPLMPTMTSTTAAMPSRTAAESKQTTTTSQGQTNKDDDDDDEQSVPTPSAHFWHIDG